MMIAAIVDVSMTMIADVIETKLSSLIKKPASAGFFIAC
ncbi:hypothetical protein OYT1_ch0344 [Ferriphaselus amnicola]|uniref:Uncharacterized protein n=1 Tax=Ferriphaselus amnicola TaxID=1188319 RepID=A0A2Z6G8X9_9PROT|nr:hypothetical protein OYT1_ch0344 [Ferriphaselus amnicola]